VYVSVTCAYRAVTALSMRLFSSSDKHSLQKVYSQHLVQVNLVADLCRVFAVYVLAMHVIRSDKAKNQSIYCITRACRCAKAESCLCNICVYVIYELNV